jgi:hypothetical protein
MSEVNNAGKKGSFVAKILLFFFFFVILWAYIYYANYNGVPQ